MSLLDRVGRIGSLDVRLAKHRPAEGRYQRRLSPVVPSEGFAAGDQFQLNAVPDTQVWNINQWSGGEGNGLYSEDERSVFHRSDGVRPTPTGEGLILGALGGLTLNSSGGTFADGSRFGFAAPTPDVPMFLVGNVATVYGWNVTSERWTYAYATGAGTDQKITSMAHVASRVYSGHDLTGQVRYWNESVNGVQYGTIVGFSVAPPIVEYRGVLYGLDWGDLYSVSTSSVDTRTQLVSTNANSYYAELPDSWRSMTVSDKGPVWVERRNSGEAVLWEYNVGSAAGAIIGQIYHKHAFPYSVAFVAGVYLVGYRATTHGVWAGDAFLHVQSGSTTSTVPIRSLTGVTANKPVLIAGVAGSDVIVYFDGAVWAYNLSTGGVHMVGKQTSTGVPSDAAVFGGDVFLAGVGSGGLNVERIRLDRYMASGTYESGRFDIRYPGMPKTMTEVTVTTDPLPAGTSVSLAVAADGTYTNIAGAHDTDGSTFHTFVVSDETQTLVGREFEIKLTLATSDQTATPTVRSVSAVVTGAAHIEEWVLEVDVSDVDAPGGQHGWDVVDRLRSLAAAQQVVTFLNPWEQRGTEGPDSVPVKVMDVILPQAGRGDAYATVRLRRVSLVVA